MTRRRTAGLVIGGALVLAAAAGWIFQDEILLEGVAFAAQRRLPVGPNRPVVWERGADPTGRPPSERPPNIVLIVADDLGWNDLTFGGGGVAGGSVPTPNIDSLARDGVSFSAGYSANGTCAPSRAALMSGRYGTRFGFEFTPTPPGMSSLVPHLANRMPGRLRPTFRLEGEQLSFDAMGMPASEITLAELLKGAGYHTVHIGKWHLGGANGMAPHEQGFDESLLAGERALSAGGRSRRRELEAGLRSDRSLPVARAQARGVVQRRRSLRPGGLRHGLLHATRP